MWELLALSFGVAGAGFASGGLTLAWRWREATLLRLIALGAGTLLGAAFLHILPEAIEVAGPRASIAALGGFLLLYVVERFVFTHPCEEDVCDYHKLGVMAYVGISIHSAVDGLALGTGVLIPKVTIPIFLALLLHQVPTSFALASILIGGKFPRRTVLSYLTVISLAIPAGAILAFLGLSRLPAGSSHAIQGYLLGFSSGTFLYLAASDLLPEIHKGEEGKGSVFASVLAGIGVMGLLALALG